MLSHFVTILSGFTKNTSMKPLMAGSLASGESRGTPDLTKKSSVEWEDNKLLYTAS